MHLWVKVLFDVKGTGLQMGDTVLCEWGQGYCIIALYHHPNKYITKLKIYSLDPLSPMTEINEVIAAVKGFQTSPERFVFCSAFPEAVLTPQQLSNGADKINASFFPPNIDVLQDRIGEWQLTNNYSFPAAISKALAENFPKAFYYHCYTTALKIYNGVEEATQLQVHFIQKQFRVIVKKSGKLEAAQLYKYNTPLDVIYYLLKITEKLSLVKEETVVVLSGLIDEDSPLYKEIFQYFRNIQFVRPQAVTMEKDDHPAHFFSSMFNLAACVS